MGVRDELMLQERIMFLMTTHVSNRMMTRINGLYKVYKNLKNGTLTQLRLV